MLTHSTTPWTPGRFLSVAIAIALLPCCAASAQTPSEKPSLAGIAHAAIRVSHLAISREFYEKLGYEEAFSMNQGGTPAEAFLKVNDRQFIELYPQRNPSEQIGFMHVCFESSNLEALNESYRSAGLSPTPVKRAGAGNLLFTMEGPEKQNIEYTQYMPGSRHTSDRGMHLGPNRISDHIAGLGIEMSDPAAASMFYTRKLAFTPASSPLRPRFTTLDIPGAPGEALEIVPRKNDSAFAMFLSVPDLKRAAVQLKALHLAFLRHKSTLTIRDPDGNLIIFLRS